MPTESNIKSVRYFDCGRCFNQLAFVYKKRKPEHRAFPSGVFLIEHATEGFILFDTGYSSSLFNTGIKGWLYRRLNPTKFSRADEIDVQLKEAGISPEDIKYVILSHLHPDHIGGIKFFPQATFLITGGSRQTLESPRFKDLVFEAMIPSWFTQKMRVLEPEKFQSLPELNITGFDLFDDGAVVLTEIPGHSLGHLGALIGGKILLAGDACWGTDLMCCSDQMRAVGRTIQHDYSDYVQSIRTLENLQAQGIELCFSHDRYPNHLILAQGK